MTRQNIVLDNETINQIRWLAQRWGQPEQRHYSAVITRSVERAFLAESTGINIEFIDKLTEDEFMMLRMALVNYIADIKAKAETMEARPDAMSLLLSDIDQLEIIVSKMFA